MRQTPWWSVWACSAGCTVQCALWKQPSASNSASPCSLLSQRPTSLSGWLFWYSSFLFSTSLLHIFQVIGTFIAIWISVKWAENSSVWAFSLLYFLCKNYFTVNLYKDFAFIPKRMHERRSRYFPIKFLFWIRKYYLSSSFFNCLFFQETEEVKVAGENRMYYLDSSHENLGAIADDVKRRRRSLGISESDLQ